MAMTGMAGATITVTAGMAVVRMAMVTRMVALVPLMAVLLAVAVPTVVLVPRMPALLAGAARTVVLAPRMPVLLEVLALMAVRHAVAVRITKPMNAS